jgi:hypothetical protein
VNATRIRLTVGVVGAAAVALIAVVLPPLGATVAGATHPCASSSDGSPMPDYGTDHDCHGNIIPAPAQGTELVLTNGDSGRTVTMALGQRLRVELGPDLWPEITAGTALHRRYFEIRRDRTVAGFTALSPTAGQQVSAVSDAACLHSTPPCASPQRQWQVTVVVDDRADASPTPSPSCVRRPIASIGPGILLLEQQSDSRTVTVKLGQRIDVSFYGCDSAADYGLATAGPQLLRQGAIADNPGGATAMFTAVAGGTTDITAVRDAPCLHEPSPCAVDPHVWRVTVNVIDPGPCEMSNPVVTGNITTWSTAVPAGATVRLSGHVKPNAAVQVWFKSYGAPAYEIRRRLVADPDGAFSTTFTPVTDHRWYATSGDCETTPGITRIMPFLVAPRLVARGSTVPVVVRGQALQPVQMWMRSPGGTFTLRRTGRLDGYGVYRTSYVARTDERYYAVTGAGYRDTPRVLTQVR